MRAMGLLASTLAGMLLLPAVAVCAAPEAGHGNSGISPPAAHIRSEAQSMPHPGIQPGHKQRAPMGGAGGDAVGAPSGGFHGGEGMRGNIESGLIVSGEGRIVSTRPREMDSADAPGADSRPAAHATHAKPATIRAGLGVRSLSPAERQYLGVSDGGLLVTSVGDVAARQAGLKEGDVVLMLDGVSVSEPDQFRQLLQQLPHDRPVPVLVRRPGTTLFLPLESPAH